MSFRIDNRGEKVQVRSGAAVSAPGPTSVGPVVLHGFDELVAALQNVEIGAVRPILRRALSAAAKVCLAKAREYTPVAGPSDIHASLFQKGYSPGDLRNSWKVKTKTRKGVMSASVGSAGSNNMFAGKTFYGGMVEFGTSRQVAQSPLRRAMQDTASQAVAAMRTGMAQGLERYFKRQAKAAAA